MKDNPNTLIVDSGNLAYSIDQAELILDVMKELGYTATGVGEMDMRIGNEFYSAAKERGIQVLGACPDQPESVKPYIVKEINGVRVGVVSFGVSQARSLGDTEPMAVLKARYKAFLEARKASDFLILLDQAGVATDDWLERNAARLGSPDIVIGSAGSPSRGSLTGSRMVGTTTIAPVSPQARNIGVVKVYAGDKSKISVETESVELGEKYAEDQKIAEAVEKVREQQTKRFTENRERSVHPGAYPRTPPGGVPPSPPPTQPAESTTETPQK